MNDGPSHHEAVPGPVERRHPTVVALACAIGTGCAMFDQTSLMVAVATIGRDLGADIAGLQWLTALLALTAASAMPISGMLGERFGARTTLQLGLLIFAGGAAVAALASSLPTLLVARVIQGLGAAMIFPNAPTLVGGNVPSGPVRTRAIGLWVVASSAGLLLGPLVGGVLVQEFGWRVTFVTLIPIALLGAMAVSVLDNTQRRRPGRLDIAGLSTVCAALALVSWVLIESGRGSTPGVILLGGFGLGSALLWLFAVIERRAAHPVLDLNLLRSGPMRSLLAATLLYNAAINGSAFVLSIHFQQGRGFSASLTGALMLVANAGMPLAGSLVSILRRRAGGASLMTLSLLALSAAFVFLAVSDGLPVSSLLLPLAMLGLCSGILYSIDTLTVLDATQGHQSAPAMASLALMRQVGSVLGIATLASAGQISVTLGIAQRGEGTALVIAAVVLAAVGTMIKHTLGRPARPAQ